LISSENGWYVILVDLNVQGWVCGGDVNKDDMVRRNASAVNCCGGV